MESALRYIQSEWAVIKEAPFTFLLLAAILFGVAYLFFAETLRRRKELIGSLREQNAQFKTETNSNSPDEAGRRIAELEQRVASMAAPSLGEEERRNLVNKVASGPGTINISVDGASGRYRKMQHQLADAFKSAGWQVSTGMVIGIGDPPKTGIQIITSQSSSAAQLVCEGFDAAGMSYDQKTDPKQKEDEITILLSDAISG